MNKDNNFSPLDNKEERLCLTSRKKWFWLGVTIAILNPIFSGLIIAIAFWTEPELKKQAKIILVISLIWGFILFYLSGWMVNQGYLPAY